MRGDQGVGDGQGLTGLGSSPRAGTSSGVRTAGVGAWVHPRARGDQLLDGRRIHVHGGPSPRAGTSRPNSCRPCCRWVHPRARGPDAEAGAEVRRWGSIPARAGTRWVPMRRQMTCGVHPRARGDQLLRRHPPLTNPGPSPRARGPEQLTCGFIARHPGFLQLPRTPAHHPSPAYCSPQPPDAPAPAAYPQVTPTSSPTADTYRALRGTQLPAGGARFTRPPADATCVRPGTARKPGRRTNRRPRRGGWTRHDVAPRLPSLRKSRVTRRAGASPCRPASARSTSPTGDTNTTTETHCALAAGRTMISLTSTCGGWEMA